MSGNKTARVILREQRTDDGEVSLLEAYMDDDGALVVAGCDLGKTVEAVWGDSDYEYWRKVSPEHVPFVLTQLIKDRFDDDTAFHDWLVGKGIPDTFSSWV